MGASTDPENLKGPFMKNRLFSSDVVKVLFFALLVARPSGAAERNRALEESLKAKYELAKAGTDWVRVTKPGTVLVVQKEGILTDLALSMPPMNKVVDGNVTQSKGFMAFMSSSENQRVLKPGDKLYVDQIVVKGNEVVFFVFTCDTYEVHIRGTTRQTRYKAVLAFQFPQGFLETADAGGVKKVIDKVLVPEAEMGAVNTKTIELGQTPEQVEAILGKPEKIVKLGSKVTYIYKDMKVIFVDGKVADAQ